MSSSPACVRVRAAVPAGSSRTLTAPRAASASAHGRMRSATRTTRKERSRNNASIEKRMKNIVIEPVLVMSSASPGARPGRGIRPKPRVRKLLATSQRVASTVPRVRFVTVRGPRGVLDRAAGLHRGECGGRQNHDEERGEDTADRRQHDEDRGPCRLLLGALAALGTQRLRLDAQHLRHRHTELVGLNDRGDEALQLLYIDALADPPQRFLTGLADALLASGAFELVAQGSLHLLGYLHESGIEAEAGLDRDREQVERVGELFEDRVAASAGPVAQVEVRRKEPEDQATEKSSERGERVARHEVQERGARDRAEDANKGLNAEEELDARGLHGGALEANLKRPRRVRRVKARHDRGESRDDRLEGPFGDRPLKLELFERSRAHRDLLQAGLHRIELAPHEERGEHHENPDTREDGEGEEFHG